MTRIFISIDIPEEVKEQIRKIQISLPEFFGKKTEPENLHLTLKFLGEINEQEIEKIKNKLREIKFNEFEVEVNGIGVFSEKFVRIVWLHVKNCDELQKVIDNKLKDLFKEEKRFMSHLTIARVKRIEDGEEFLKNLDKVKIPKIKFKVKSFELRKSILTKQKSVYETLESYELREM